MKISVQDQAGNVVGQGTSDNTGTFDIPLPGKSIDNLGKTFTIHIDTASLPQGAALANPKQVSLKVRLKLDSDVFVTFPIGDAPGAARASSPRPSSSRWAAWCSRCCWRWPRWDCR